jgi:hypothetical protein
VEVSTTDADFCIDVPSSEGCPDACRGDLIGAPVVFSRAIVVQDTSGGCAAGLGGALNPGCRGILDGTVLAPSDAFPARLYRMVPFRLDVVVPDDPEGVTVHLDYVEAFRFLSGEIAENAVIRDNTFVRADPIGEQRFSIDTTSGSITVRPFPGGAFIRCDVNDDGGMDISDAVAIARWSLIGGPRGVRGSCGL